jgi:hypothetical protein
MKTTPWNSLGEINPHSRRQPQPPEVSAQWKPNPMYACFPIFFAGSRLGGGREGTAPRPGSWRIPSRYSRRFRFAAGGALFYAHAARPVPLHWVSFGPLFCFPRMPRERVHYGGRAKWFFSELHLSITSIYIYIYIFG